MFCLIFFYQLISNPISMFIPSGIIICLQRKCTGVTIRIFQFNLASGCNILIQVCHIIFLIRCNFLYRFNSGIFPESDFKCCFFSQSVSPCFEVIRLIFFHSISDYETTVQALIIIRTKQVSVCIIQFPIGSVFSIRPERRCYVLVRCITEPSGCLFFIHGDCIISSQFQCCCICFAFFQCRFCFYCYRIGSFYCCITPCLNMDSIFPWLQIPAVWIQLCILITFHCQEDLHCIAPSVYIRYSYPVIFPF